jgi:uncharacterized protein YndB with AHSA1/START domain
MKWLLISLFVLIAVILLVILIGLSLPKQHVASRSATFRQSPETVWAVITGPPTWRPDLKGYEELPVRSGHRTWRETDKHGQAITYEAVESVAPRKLVVRIADEKLPFGGTWTYDIIAVAGGSSLTITENGEVYNPIFRFVSRFIIGHASTIETYLQALANKFGENVRAAGAKAH